MSPKVTPVPKGYEAPTPYLIIRGAAKAIDFYTKAFGAKETGRFPGPDGKIGHADLIIGGGHIMLADESPEMGHKSPDALGATPVSLVIYVDNADDVVKKAVAAGGKLTRPVEDQFYGDRAGEVRDPFGHVWHVMTHIEDVSEQEMMKRMAAKMPAVSA
ncbi:MAG TPA: VOC family protein [Thermoanaerobaculia bacterium]